jgi:predicted transport protein
VATYRSTQLSVFFGDEVKEIYSELKSATLNLDKDIAVRPKKNYIVFRRKQNFVAFHFLGSKLRVWLNIGISQIKDPLKKARNDPGSDNKYITIMIQDRSEIPYALSLIKQAYEKS